MSAEQHEVPDEMTFEQFLTFELAYRGEERFELVDGRVVMVNGGTERHDLTVTALFKRLMPLDEPPCRLFVHNRKIKASTRDGYYPDVLLVCGRASHRLFETDARVVIEVLSPSNTARDRLLRLYRYQALSSVEVILFIDADRQVVTAHSRQGPDWVETQTAPGEGLVTVASVTLDFAEVWADVEKRATTD